MIRKNVSVERRHDDWIDEQDDFNFSEWVREKLDEEMDDE